MLYLFLLTTGLSVAQDWNWGEKVTQSKGDWMYLDVCMNEENYDNAKGPVSNLLKNAPELNEALYVIGIKVYKNLAKKEKDKILKQQYQDTVLMLFDKRMELFGGEANIYNRKCSVLWRYSYRASSENDLLAIKEYYDKCFELNGEKTYKVNYYYYFSLCSKMKKLGYMSDVDYYNMYKLCKSKVEKDSYLDKMKSLYDSYMNIDCDFISSVLYEEFVANKTVEQSEFLLLSLKDNGCENDSLKESLLVFNYETEGGYDHAYDLAVFYVDKNMDKSIELLKECETMDVDSLKHDKVCLMLSQCYFNKHMFSRSREYALKAEENFYKECHKIIGDLYYNSYKNYSGYDQRLVFIAAYEEYKKSGSSNLVSVCQEQFPSMEEIFVRGKSPGDYDHIGGWINKDVALKKRL